MKMSELSKKTAAELEKLAQKQRQDLSQTVLDYHSKEVKNVRQLRNQKKDLARILTAQRLQAIASEGDK